MNHWRLTNMGATYARCVGSCQFAGVRAFASARLASVSSRRDDGSRRLLQVVNSQSQIRHFNYRAHLEKMFPFLKKTTAVQHRKMDGVDESYRLVYMGDAIIYVKMLVAGVELTALALLGSAGAWQLGVVDYPPFYNAPIYEPISYCVFLTFIFSSCFHFTRIYPLRMYYNEEKENFIVIFLGYTPFTTRKLTLGHSAAKRLPRSYISDNILPWYSDMCRLQNGKKLLVIPSNFEMPHYYNLFLGY